MEGNTLLIGLLVVVGFIGLIVIGLYNSLIAKKNQVQNAFASLDANLKKRYDLIPNLVATVKGYVTHERELLTRITELRAQAVAGDMAAKVAVDDQLSSATKQIIAVAESYPALQASGNFLHLQATLNEVEEQISASRRAYNAAVTEYNNALQMFPSSLMAGAMNLQPIRWFEISDDERANVDVSGLSSRTNS